MPLDASIALPDLQLLISRRLPTWLAKASPDDVQALYSLCEHAHEARDRLKACAQALDDYEAYARQRLAPLLASLGEAGVDAGRVMLYWPSPNDETAPLTCTLIQAALRNFTEEDTHAEAYGPGSGLFHCIAGDGPLERDTTRPLSITPWAFAQACRTADIGSGFAGLLTRQLPVRAEGAPPADALPTVYEEADRTTLAAEALIAKLTGKVDTVGLSLLASAGVIDAGAWPKLPAQAKRLKLAGFDLNAVMLVIGDDNSPAGRPCVLYIPNDPNAPLTQFPNLDALMADLQRRVHHPAYLRFLAGYVGLKNQAAFIRAVEGPPLDDFDRLFATVVNPIAALTLVIRAVSHQRLFEPPSITLNLANLSEVFPDRYTQWREKTLADATLLAVPTERQDRLAAQARHAKWTALGESLGLFVLSFIPGVGEITGVYSMVQSLRSVFEASKAWSKGDERQARILLLGAVDNVIGLRLSPRPPADAQGALLAERLRLVTNAAGEQRLWIPDTHLSGSDHPPAGATPLTPAGLVTRGERQWVRMAGRYVEVERGATDRQAQLRLPVDHDGLAPRLLSNGHGGWRSEYENPGQWQGVHLIRRCTTEAIGLNDSEVALAQELAGVDDSQLQGRAWRTEPLPGMLRYHLRRRVHRQRLLQGVASLRSQGQLPHAAPEIVRTLVDVPSWPQSVGLEWRQPDGSLSSLHPNADRLVRVSANEFAQGTWATELIKQMRSEDLAPLVGKGVFAEAFRQRMSQQWADVLERNCLELAHQLSQDPVPQGPVATVMRQFTSLPEQVATELVAHSNSQQRAGLEAGRVPLPVAELAAEFQRQLRVSLACEALYDGYSTPDAQILLQRLPEALGQGFSSLPPAGPAPGPLPQLAEAALAQRDTVRRLLGMAVDSRRFFRLPARLQDGRLGYLLSGRGSARSTMVSPIDAITLLLRQLYPEANAPALQALRAEVGEGAAALEAISRRERELTDLREALNQWRDAMPQGPAHSIAHSMEVREARYEAATTIMRSWQRSFITHGIHANGAPRYVLNLSYLTLGGELPILPASFPHVTEVWLAGLRLTRIDPAFLECFPNARMLSLENNPLTELPQGPQWLHRLHEVELREIGPGGSRQVVNWLLPSAGTLRRLSLSQNPALPMDALMQHLGQFTALTDLELNDVGLVITPERAGVFNTLTNLVSLSLNDNPLALPPRVDSLHRLNWLSLANTDLEALPPGLEQLMVASPLRLSYINLGDNRIRQLPDLRNTAFVRQAAQPEPYGISSVELILDGNPLDEAAVAQLDEAGIDFDPVPQLVQPDPQGAFEDQWLVGCPALLEHEIRSARQERAAGPFYEVLSRIVQTAPYVRAIRAAERTEVLSRAWDLARLLLMPGEQPMPGLAQLRDRLYNMATEAQATCGDGIVLTIDQFDSEVMVWRAITHSMSASEEGPLRDAALSARRIYRQALLDGQAQRLVRARVARLAGNVPADPATDLGDDLPNTQLDMGIDEVELRLVLRQQLRTRLDLPPVSERLYEALVSEATQSRIAERVHALDTDEGFADWLVDHQNTWYAAIESRYELALDEVRAPYHDALEHVLTLAAGQQPTEPPTPQSLSVLEAIDPTVNWTAQPQLNEQQARTLSNRLRDRCNQAVRTQILQLTRGLIS